MVKQSESFDRFSQNLRFLYQLYGGLFHVFCEPTAHLYKDKNKNVEKVMYREC